MSGNLTIRQRMLGHSRVFQFERESLLYTLRDQSGERTFSVPYQVIDAKNVSGVRSKNPRFARTLTRAAIVGALAAFAITTVNSTIGAIVGIASVCAYAMIWAAETAGLFSVSFTHIPMAPVPPGANSNLLSIIGDQNRDQIVDELAKRSRERLRALYGTVDLSGDQGREAARMQWLKERGVISEDEYSEQMKRLRDHHNSDQGSEERRLN